MIFLRGVEGVFQATTQYIRRCRTAAALRLEFDSKIDSGFPLTLTLSPRGEGPFLTSSPLGERIEVRGKQTTETNFHAVATAGHGGLIRKLSGSQRKLSNKLVWLEKPPPPRAVQIRIGYKTHKNFGLFCQIKCHE